jgi:UDP-N-acetylmuramoyl-L-alanyl-D-glutamate--2,6-diaminopimelate ligase
MTTEHRTATLASLASSAGDILIAAEFQDAASVTGVAYDSRAVRRGDLFFCVVGLTSDGHDHAPEAISSGASALCVERPLGLGVPEIEVSDSRIAMARLSAAFFGRPADELLMLGITGTNGKTTTAYLIESILSAAGHTTGLIGTIETRIAGERRPGLRTTPESLDLQALLSAMRERGVDSVAMEVTSHALALHRVEGVRFAAAAFTNLSQDHLDFHTDMEDYFAAKRSLFVPSRVRAGATNLDDPYGRKLIDVSDVEMISFGTAPDADVHPERVRAGPWGQEFVAITPAGDLKISTSLIGAFNQSNCLAAIAVAQQAGIAADAIESGLAAVRGVPGRFEAVDAGQPFAVIVDYSHKPAALDNVLREARGIASDAGGKVLVTFGCGGDRDRAKRPLMGAIAARLADVVIVTSDNPRSEDPNAIIDSILEGVAAERAEGPDAVIVDRREAIEALIGRARAGDVVVIAGKGHETGQRIGSTTFPFDDREVARDALTTREERGEGSADAKGERGATRAGPNREGTSGA